MFEQCITKSDVFRAKHRQTFIFKHFVRQKVISLQFYSGGSFRGPAATHPSRQNLKVSFVGGSRPALRRPTRRTNTQTEYSPSPPAPPLQRAQEWNEISRSGALTLIYTYIYTMSYIHIVDGKEVTPRIVAHN